MDMRQLFGGFKKHVESLDDNDIRQSIARAIEHSSNSSSLECEAENENGLQKLNNVLKFMADRK